MINFDFHNEPSDCVWLSETHLKGLKYPEFRSFILYGNEDSPVRVDLYESEDPNYDDPFAKFEWLICGCVVGPSGLIVNMDCTFRPEV